MIEITKVNKKTDSSKFIQDKTDWNHVYQKSQASIDLEAFRDNENPVIKSAKARRLNTDDKP